jgi:hypothetical protein
MGVGIFRPPVVIVIILNSDIPYKIVLPKYDRMMKKINI